MEKIWGQVEFAVENLVVEVVGGEYWVLKVEEKITEKLECLR